MAISLFRKKPQIYGLTARGKQRAEESAGRTPEGEILCMLEEHGESSLKEIARETHLDIRDVKMRLKRMVRLGLLDSKSEEGED